jgi:ribose transport system substrate-binding protein
VDQDAYGRLGADWLVQALGDKGKILRVTGPKDDPDQVARIAGFDAVLADHEDVTIAASIDSEGDPAVAVKALNSLLAEDPSFSGIWASGVDSVIVDALRMAERPLVPIVGGDGGAYVSQLLSTEGLEGAAVTDTPAVGGAALRLGLRAHAGDPPAAELQTLEPQRWDNLTDAGRAALTTANDPSIELGWPLDLSAPGWTEATVDDVVGCGKATNPS